MCVMFFLSTWAPPQIRSTQSPLQSIRSRGQVGVYPFTAGEKRFKQIDHDGVRSFSCTTPFSPSPRRSRLRLGFGSNAFAQWSSELDLVFSGEQQVQQHGLSPSLGCLPAVEGNSGLASAFRTRLSCVSGACMSV